MTLLLPLALLTAAINCVAQDNDLAKAPVTALTHATIIDGTGASARPDQTILIIGDTFGAIGDADMVEIPAGASVIDISGKWVTPGLIDLHVHFPPQTEVHGAILERLLEFGVTTILSPGAPPEAGVELRDAILAGDKCGPHMLTAGRSIDVAPPGARSGKGAAKVASAPEIRDEVERQARQGVDFIKLYRRMNRELAEAAIAEAKAHNLKVAAHLESLPWTEAAELGVDMLIHSGWSTPMDEIVNLPDPTSASDEDWYKGYLDAPNGEAFQTLVQKLIENDVTVVPTLAIMQAGGLGFDDSLLPLFETDLAPERDVPGWWGEGWRERHPQYSDDVDSAEARLLEEVYFPALLEIQRAFYLRGVRLGVGTDVGNPWITPGASFHYEMALYQQAGIPPAAILTMATRNGAEALGLEAVTGAIEIGKRADLLVLGADPTADIRNARAIEMVFLAGKRIAR